MFDGGCGAREEPERHESPFAPTDARRLRTHEALLWITERRARGEHRVRWEERGVPVVPFDAVRCVADLAAGSVVAREEFDQVEAGLLSMAKGRGISWQELSHGPVPGSAQAARQRHERLDRRTASRP